MGSQGPEQGEASPGPRAGVLHLPCPSRWPGMLKGERLYPEAEVGWAGGDP